MICPACGAENRPGRNFCSKCGTALARACPNCGAANEPDDAFCGACGAALADTAAQPAAPAPAAPVAERRLVSVLFADLVGFTAASENRDAEETRELLSRYFETCRRVIGRYGGTVEKFIGDAVMAVWGTPVAQEDDAERAVRAALDLVATVPDLDSRLQARAGALTGEAAVTIGAEGEGMVAGDLVNTASRAQSAAEPGTVLVGDSTRRATEAAIAYDDPVEHEVKGKEQPLRLSRALRVTAGRLGALKAAGLEAPFVGRERELRLVKELFHATAEERKARLVSIVGIAGIGKSRLAWEFEKYIDGLIDVVLWHRGRCLAYGEGVAYWALAEMVRMRAEIVEGETQDDAREKLQSALEEYVPDPEERRWVEPRLAHLLGLEEGAAHAKEDLFGAWRLFFERLAQQEPTVLVFEDMQWADASLLEFVEYLLEWSRDHRLYVLSLARPELFEEHPGWGGTKRNFSSTYLEPLSRAAMAELLAGVVPGLPEELQGEILGRAEGIPLYAVETVRMLLDRGLVVREGSVYRPTGEVTLAVPETLHALIAARLDGLSADERRIVQHAAVLGKTFSRQGVASLNGMPEDELEPVLAALTRKEILGLQADPRSPERGQYGFLQDLLRTVAYETLPKQERKEKHLAAASYLEAARAEEEEIVEVVAAHYVDAFRAAPGADDAAEIQAKARELLVHAAERALSLAAAAAAQRYFEQAIELTEDPEACAALHERAGQAAWNALKGEDARRHYERAIELREAAGQAHDAARVTARLGEIDLAEGQLEQAIERLEPAFELLGGGSPDPDVAALAAQLGRVHFLRGNIDAAAPIVEVALDMAEKLRLPELISQALNTKAALTAMHRGHMEEGLALVRHALAVALEADAGSATLRAYYNLGFLLFALDRHEEMLELDLEALELARRVGDRAWETLIRAGDIESLVFVGRWDDALRVGAELQSPENENQLVIAAAELLTLARVHALRGDYAAADEVLAPADSLVVEQPEARPKYLAERAAVFLAAGRPREALVAAEQALQEAGELTWAHPSFKAAVLLVLEAAVATGEFERADELFALWDKRMPGERTPQIDAQFSRLRARVTAARGGDPELGLKRAAALFREQPMPFWLGVTLLEQAEWLTDNGRAGEADPLLEEARAIFERLRAAPWLDRVAAIAQHEPAPAAV